MKSATIKSWPLEAVPGVVDMSSWTKLTYLDIWHTQFTSVPVFPSSLTYLEAEGVVIGLNDFEFDQKDFFQLPKLEYLSIKNSDFFTVVNDMANPALASGSLKELCVCSNSIMTQTSNRNNWFKSLPAPSSALTMLSLRGHFDLPENIIIALLRRYPNLEGVGLGHTSVTGSTVRELFERKKKPDYVDLEGCDSCYYDAVDAARKAGIDVRHELAPKNNKTERRVREQY